MSLWWTWAVQDSKMETESEQDFNIYAVEEACGKRHTLLQAPHALPGSLSSNKTIQTHDVFNILMADVSGSMSSYWGEVVTGWQNHIKDKLTGLTKIYVFGSNVQMRRVGTDLYKEDFVGSGTDLTTALRTVRLEVEDCSKKIIRVFIITDGQHGHGEPLPDSEISLMKAPTGKTVSVFLLGISAYFPVEYSISIRSYLHNGNANMPSLFWAKDGSEIVEEIENIGNELNAGLVTMTLNHQGYILPGSSKTAKIHLGEWLFYDEPPEDLPPLTVRVDEEEQPLHFTRKDMSVRQLLDSTFRQWNSVLIQLHRKKEHVPLETFDLMDSLFNKYFEDLKGSLVDGNSIQARILNKRIKGSKTEYATLMNQSKTIIGIEGKYQTEIELAESILKTTVTSRKYDTRNLKLKGHGQDDYVADVKAFRKLYESLKDQIQALPPDECCTIFLTSTLQDLKDPHFTMVLEENKFELLKTFAITGIPVYAPIRDASQINPWTMVIKHILVSPYTILSQQTLEASADINQDVNSSEDKDILLNQEDEKSRFNIIVPIVPAHAAEVLKPLVQSNLYAMMATFCILKNPHIIDYDAHLAALGCAWMRTVREFPISSRPEFASHRLQNIASTANIYMSRPGVNRYVNALLNNPNQALMTESKDEFDGRTLKCESLIKPLFFLGLNKDKISLSQAENLLRLLLEEFIGRCLSNYKLDDAEATPFTDFFAPELKDPEKKKAWLEQYYQGVVGEFESSQGDLLKTFFSLDDLRTSINKFVVQKMSSLSDQIMKEIQIGLAMQKIQNLRNFGSCGDIMWPSFKCWADEMGMTEENKTPAFSEKQIQVYVCHALMHRNSRERLSQDLPTQEEALEIIRKKVSQENSRNLRSTLTKETEEFTVQKWRKIYMEVHSPLVMPMTRQEVVEAAQARGVQVTLENFSSTYRYDERLLLVRNACQIPSCPHFLQPHRNFNQHLSIERERPNFPHALHIASYEYKDANVDTVVERLAAGSHAGTRNRQMPPPPEPTSLASLKEEMAELLTRYKSM
ncbi:uncharacterized protein LOC134773155 isoform X2 [Penaeus indicus]|uniref:uncharacterized protein LOC134773155 isoform X2 n=1 Tax=Penaeus indicus TaxID=29960 RepID=UPI00300CFA57